MPCYLKSHPENTEECHNYKDDYLTPALQKPNQLGFELLNPYSKLDQNNNTGAQTISPKSGQVHCQQTRSKQQVPHLKFKKKSKIKCTDCRTGQQPFHWYVPPTYQYRPHPGEGCK